MPTESQNIEFKESWRDEYQKWICGFANAQGGTLYIGLHNNGEVCGVQDAKKLGGLPLPYQFPWEVLPAKRYDQLGTETGCRLVVPSRPGNVCDRSICKGGLLS